MVVENLSHSPYYSLKFQACTCTNMYKENLWIDPSLIPKANKRSLCGHTQASFDVWCSVSQLCTNFKHTAWSLKFTSRPQTACRVSMFFLVLSKGNYCPQLSLLFWAFWVHSSFVSFSLPESDELLVPNLCSLKGLSTGANNQSYIFKKSHQRPDLS